MSNEFVPGWYKVEIMGHRVEVGYCTEVPRFGTAMLCVSIPGLPEIPGTERPATKRVTCWDSIAHEDIVEVKTGRYVRSTVSAVPATELMFTGNAIFSMEPVTEEWAMSYYQESHRPLPERWVPDETAQLLQIEAPPTADEIMGFTACVICGEADGHSPECPLGDPDEASRGDFNGR